MHSKGIIICTIYTILISCNSKVSNCNQLIHKADSFYNCHKFDSALKYYCLVEECDTFMGYYFKRGNCFAANSRHKEAINDYLINLKTNYRLSDTYNNLAGSYGLINNLPKSYFYYKKVLQIQPNDTIAKEQVSAIGELLNIK